MISDEYVIELFQKAQHVLNKHWDSKESLRTQFHRGIGPHSWENQHPGGCNRHLAIFNKHNVIPKYCFDCYKVVPEPRTVMELFKLMVVFESLTLPNDNTRKCIVETRENITGAYKGFVYCRGMEEGREVHKAIQKIVSEKISTNIPVILKRGCSEYPLAYPEYARIDKDTESMRYIDEWQEYEDLFDSHMVAGKQLPASVTHNKPAYDLEDAKIMLAWLVYAATIGDLSYLKIAGRVLQPFPNVKRPAPFYPPDE